MTNSIQDLRERRAAKAAEARKLLDDNAGDKWNAQVSGQVDTVYAELDALDDQIGKLDKLRTFEADDAADEADALRNARGIKDSFDARDPANAGRVLYNAWLRGGIDGLSAQQASSFRNTMSTTTGSQGGYTVPSLIASDLYGAMKAYGCMRSLAQSFTTSDGRPLSFPTSDGTSETGEWIAQNTTATGADPSFGTVSLNVFKGSSKIVAVPFELLQDSTIDMEAFVRARLAQRLGRLGNTAFTVGTGTTQPDGVVPKATLGKTGTTGQTLTIIYDDVVDLIHSVDPAYRSGNCSFMGSDGLIKVLRKLKDTANMPIWQPNRNEGIRQGPTDAGTTESTSARYDTLLGYPMYVNNDMDAPGVSKKTLLFGDFSYYKIRDALEVSMFRFTDSAYTILGQVGFLAWARMGGNLVDTTAVKYYVHSAT